MLSCRGASRGSGPATVGSDEARCRAGYVEANHARARMRHPAFRVAGSAIVWPSAPAPPVTSSAIRGEAALDERRGQRGLADSAPAERQHRMNRGKET